MAFIDGPPPGSPGIARGACSCAAASVAVGGGYISRSCSEAESLNGWLICSPSWSIQPILYYRTKHREDKQYNTKYTHCNTTCKRRRDKEKNCFRKTGTMLKDFKKKQMKSIQPKQVSSVAVFFTPSLIPFDNIL